MSNVNLEQIKPRLRKYVDRNSNTYNIEWDPQISEKLLIDPFDKSHEGRRRTAHYFLLVASITETQLIGRAENSRALMIHFHDKMNNDLFKAQNASLFKEHITGSPFYVDLGPEKDYIPEVLVSVNQFVHDIAEEDLIRFTEKYTKPTEVVEEIAQHVKRMDGLYREKPWMYLRWMTRPDPDLGIFHFSTADLLVPVTSYLRDVAHCLMLCPESDSEFLENIENRAKARESITSFARELFPEDPTKVDYPLYLLGRWLRGRQLSLQLLRGYLDFFEDLYDKTHTVPVTYDIVSRRMSSFEENVRAELQKTQLVFYYESHKFNLPGGITYLPDFVLPKCKRKGKTVLLEPHGIWSYPKRRIANIGGRRMTFQAYGTEKDTSETRFTEKIRLFRETYGRDFYLILLVPARVKERIESLYPHSFDEIYVGTDIPKLLYELKQHTN